ncbi:MAG TPA: hypothetical protein VKK31_17050 [Thermoanaerobaculia bacterium]|nr:hypothetical protein [Thermoanaerobaculia bacterium]
MTLQVLKTVAEICQSFAIAGATLFGGLWAYHKFVQQREDKPNVETTHIVSYKVIESGYLLSVVVRLRNVGKVMVSMRLLKVILGQVLPLTEGVLKEIKSGGPPPEIDRRTRVWKDSENACLEPNEPQVLTFYFTVPSTISLVEIETFFRDESAENGWTHRTIASLSRKTPTKRRTEGMSNESAELLDELIMVPSEPEGPDSPDSKESDPDSRRKPKAQSPI